jgi:hypothetical protein
MESEAPEEKPNTRAIWLRGLFMLLFMFGFGVGQWLLYLLAVVQFFWLLFAGKANEFIVHFGNSLSVWLSEVARFLICLSDDKPFPWRPWPDGPGTGIPPKLTSS